MVSASSRDIGLTTTKVLENVLHIVAAYLFGSATSGRLGPESDIDLGILFATDHLPTVDARLGLADRLAQALGREVDLVVLNQASPIIVHQALRGKRLLCRDHAAMVAFVVRANADYDDIKRVRSPIERALLKARSFHG